MSEPIILSQQMYGGFNDKDSPANEDIQKIIDKLQEDIKTKTGNKNYKYLKAISYKTQVVAGVNYIIKVDTGDDHLHVKIHEPLSHTNQSYHLTGVQKGKRAEDILEVF